VADLLNSSKIQTGLPQLPEGWPKELYSAAFTLYAAHHNLEVALSKYAGVDPQPSQYWSELTVDDTIYDGNMNRWYTQATEVISYGAIVSPIDSGGKTKVRNANATNNTRFACGICNTVGGAGAGDYCEVIGLRGIVSGITGMTRGTIYFLSTTNGLITNAEPVAAGNIGQVIGFAIATNRLWLNINLQFVQH
jgi:hypothetical protein